MKNSPNRHSQTIALSQTVIPDYRKPFFEDLAAALGSRLTLLSGDKDWQPDVIHADVVPSTPVRNIFAARRRFLWQSGALKPLLAADIAVMILNPRILTNWVALILRRVARRRTVLWGHAWPRTGRRSKTERVRALMRGLANTVIVYTETEATHLRDVTSSIDVIAAPNALYRRQDTSPTGQTVLPTDFVFVGRLTPSKRPALLLSSFCLIARDLPSDVRLVFVGNGPLRRALEAQARSAGLGGRIIFTGHMSAVDHLRPLYAQAIASVSPGDAGLSLIQSIGFGVPMIIAQTANHGPEIEAAVKDENAVFFTPSSISALASALLAVSDDRELWASRRALIASSARDQYCIERMVAAFVAALQANR